MIACSALLHHKSLETILEPKHRRNISPSTRSVQITGLAFLDSELAGGAAMAPVFGLKTLNLPGCQRLLAPAIEWIAAGCTLLQALDVCGCVNTTPEGVELLAASSPALKQLGIKGCVGLGDAALSFVASCGASLQRLEMSDIPQTPAGIVGKFLRNCSSLEYLDISGLTQIDRSSFSGLRSGARGTGQGVLARADDRHLSHLCHDNNVGAFPHRVAPQDATNGSSRVLVQPAMVAGNGGLRHLRVAKMLRLPRLDDVSIVALANASPHLQELLLSDSPLVTGTCLGPLSALCPLLKSLQFNRCRAASDEPAIVGALPHLINLQHLGVAHEGWGAGAVDAGFAVRESSVPSASTTGNSRAPFGGGRGLGDDGPLHADGCTHGESCTAGVLTALARYCPRLMSLGFEGHAELSFIETHAPPGAFPCLQELRLTDCSGVDDSGLAVLLRACPRVSTLLLERTRVSQKILLQSSVLLPFVEVFRSVPSSTGESAPSRRTKNDSVNVHTPAMPNRSLTTAYPLPSPASVLPRDCFSLRSDCHTASSNSCGGLMARPTMVSTTKPKPRTAPHSGNDPHVDDARAVGFRPLEHAELHLAAAAVFARFGVEQFAVRRLVRAMRHFRHRRLQRRLAAARRICRALRSYHFMSSKRHPDQVWYCRICPKPLCTGCGVLFRQR